MSLTTDPNDPRLGRGVDDVGGKPQQETYLVLSKEEREQDFVRPYRDAYRHLVCGKITTMNRAIAETYAKQPAFYGATYCLTCKGHFQVGENGEFVWYEMNGSDGPKVGT